MQGQCQEVETCFRKNNSKKAHKLVKDLTTEKQGKSTTIQDKSGKCLTDEKEILNRVTEYCSDIYNYETDWDPIVLDCPQIPDEEHHPILRRGARWLSGRVSDSGARGPGFETYRRRVVSLSKTLYSPKVLVNYPGSDGSVPT